MKTLEQAYMQVLKESYDLTNFKPKYSKEDKQEQYKQSINKKIQDYIANGSKGDLILTGKPIESLPNNLTKVSGSLWLSSTHIKSLPDNLYVGGDLDLSKSHIESLPDNLTKISGNLLLHNTPITSLPDNLHVDATLTLSRTPITSLPDNLYVGGSLYLYNTPISKQYTAEQLKQMLPNVKGKIWV